VPPQSLSGSRGEQYTRVLALQLCPELVESFIKVRAPAKLNAVAVYTVGPDSPGDLYPGCQH
jgi:hypothetical protein